MPLKSFPALLLKRKQARILVVADLHIGWEAGLAQKGIHVPSQTPKILKRLLHLIDSCNPTKLILLGDVKHTVARVGIEEWRSIPDFFETLVKRVPEVQVVPGNHDGNLEPLLPESVRILPSTGVALGTFALFHGHTWPAPELLGCPSLIMGHLHPMVVFRDPIGFQVTSQVWVKARCNGSLLADLILRNARIKIDKDPTSSLSKNFNVKLMSLQLIIMPSFNDFLGGHPINKPTAIKTGSSKKYIGPVLNSRSININDAEIHLLDGTFLGKINQLKSFS